MKNELSNMFSDEQHNAMYTALHNAADATFEESGKLYDYIESTPRTSLVCELLMELEDLGYEVRKKND